MDGRLQEDGGAPVCPLACAEVERIPPHAMRGPLVVPTVVRAHEERRRVDEHERGLSPRDLQNSSTMRSHVAKCPTTDYLSPGSYDAPVRLLYSGYGRRRSIRLWVPAAVIGVLAIIAAHLSWV